MKFFHLSDLHLGKRVNGFSMIDDQQYILSQILSIAESERPDAVLIAGDVYDKTSPSAEAVQLFDDFLYKLSQRHIHTFVIAGNHDSAERLAFGGRLMTASGVHMAPVYNGCVEPITLEDEYGPVDFFLLPFVRPADVRRFYGEEESIGSYTEALSCAVRHMNIRPGVRSVLAAHQFVTGAARSDSEDVSVGGLDNVDAEVFAPFDYTALGHIHGPQNIGSERIRYCGTPLKYSFSECSHKKSVTVVELLEKGKVAVETVPLTPLHDVRELRGRYDELLDRQSYAGTATEDYLHITLTDEQDIPDVITRLRTVYPNIMKLDYDNARTRAGAVVFVEIEEQRSPLELFEAFFEMQNDRPMEPMQRQLAEDMMKRIWEAES